MKKRLIPIIIIILVVIILGFFLFKSLGETIQQTTENPDNINTHNNINKFNGETKEFSIIAKQWEFQPDTITVNKGDLVKLTIESVDVNHGIKISEFNINERLNPGETVNIEFIADKTGEFSFFCSVPCGSGHGSMKGTLIVN